MPCVVKPPKGVFHSAYSSGGFNRSLTTCMDYAPTIFQMLNLSLPADPKNPRRMMFQDRSVHAHRGHSWLPYFKSSPKSEETFSIYPATEPIGWELWANAALRKGDWKIVHLPKPMGGAGVGDEGWELFNVVADPGETTDLAAKHPDKTAELMRDWHEYCVSYGIVFGESAVAPGLSKDEAPGLWENDMDLQRTWLGAKAGAVPDWSRHVSTGQIEPNQKMA